MCGGYRVPLVSTAEPGERRKALLVIHGIGNQPPLRVLGAFVQGLSRAMGALRRPVDADSGAAADPARPQALLVRVAGKARPVVRMTLDPPATDQVDVYEYHWAEHAVGGMSAAATFVWLLEVVVAGLDFRRQVPFLLAGAGGGRVWPLLLRQLLQVAGLAAVAGALLVAVLVVSARAGEVLAAIRRAAGLLPELPSVPQAAALVLLVCLVAAVMVLAHDLVIASWEARRARAASSSGGRHPGSKAEADGVPEVWSGMYAPAATRWAVPGMITLFMVVVAAALTSRLVAPQLSDYGTVVATLLREPGVSVALGAVAAVAVARSLLLSHVSDIALYVTSDRLSTRARTRRAILDEGEELLLGLLERGYDGVYVAGHSLGSVVALDLLDRLARREAVGQDTRLRHVRGLLTFGSPLDKVAYFFRQRPAEGEAVRAQLLTFLHGVRRRPDMRDYGPYLLQSPPAPFETLDWLQVHAPGDLLSDRLIHYRVNRRLVLLRFNPLTAHNAYWRDERFYAGALAWLQGAEAP